MVDVFLNETDVQKVSFKERLKIFAFVCKLFLKSRKKRTYELVNADYDLGSWNRDIEKIDFDSHYGSNDKNEMVIFTFNGKILKDIRKRFEKKYNSMLLQCLLCTSYISELYMWITRYQQLTNSLSTDLYRYR